MPLTNGRHHLAIPGPSVMPDRVLNAMHRAGPNIYEGAFVDMVPGIFNDLKAVARTAHHAAIYIANGHGAWEAAAANVFSRGDKALALATGKFAYGWAELAGRMGVDVEVMDFGNRTPVDPDRLLDRLRADRAHDIKAVLAVQVDTSTSVRNDVAAMRAALDAAGHPALLMVDCIACLGCDVFEMDAWGVDVMVTGSQKGLMTPPGLGIVAFNDKADRARDQANCVTHYWDWRPRVAPEIFYQYFDGTAPTHHLYGLREALDMMNEEGLEAIWARHEALASAVWAAAQGWAECGALELNVQAPEARSHAVTVLRLGGDYGTRLRNWTEQNVGLTLGIGMVLPGEEDAGLDGYFRIGHMGHVNAQMVMAVLGTVEAGLKAIGYAHGEGALSRAAAVLAERA